MNSRRSILVGKKHRCGIMGFTKNTGGKMMRRKSLRRWLIVACFVLLSVSLFLGDNSLQKVQAATKVKINKKSVTLRYKRYTYLRVKGTSKKVKWSSTKKTVARVNSSGKVTAV